MAKNEKRPRTGSAGAFRGTVTGACFSAAALKANGDRRAGISARRSVSAGAGVTGA